MFGLTQAELAQDATYNPIDRWFMDGDLRVEPSDVTRNGYVDRIVAGRFPDVTDLAGRSRRRWFSAYVDQLVDRDVAQLEERDVQPGKLRAVLSSCAARTAQTLNKQATAEDAGVSFRTADRGLDLLEDLSIVIRLSAWHGTRVKRLTRSPKVYLADPGMAAHLLGVGAEALSVEPHLVGQMFETFVAAELRTHLETAAEETAMSHFRDQRGREVDIIIEQGRRMVGVEVKSSTQVSRPDAKGLLWLRDQLGDRFHLGIILYSGSQPFRIDDRIWALPMSSLWR